MDIFEFEDDLDAKEKGVKVYLDAGRTAYLLIAAWGTLRFWESLRKKREEICVDPELPSTDESAKSLAAAVADTVLVGWGGITENDKPVKYSRAKAVEWLSDPAKERFYYRVQTESQSIDRYKKRRLESEKK